MGVKSLGPSTCRPAGSYPFYRRVLKNIFAHAFEIIQLNTPIVTSTRHTASVYPLLPAVPIVLMIGTQRLLFPIRAPVRPDADVPGGGYADAVWRVLAAIGVTATVITPLAGVKSGWDAADALAEGWDEERARALVDQARPPPSWTGVDGSSEKKCGSGRDGDGVSPS